ncbi:hypothetical protein PJM41_0006 [Salmonella phage vB_SenS_UTK0009]|uniref:Uncharacterized protein n=1 Tax=Salmonella phage vB_SenS_UTK0009 TaxID=3028908 RepID=A0AAE9ZI69_9CAUD|nr:hypothetical protein [Salmonella enterica]WDR22091.1 hypothetical protein PJM41_0006 [Salmonella phage vB_SenS_UTK0009]
MQNIISPKIGQSVFVPFITKLNEETGKVEKLQGAALDPWDTINAVYAETEKTKSGKTAFNVRLNSGDAVKIIQKDDKWQAVA